MRDTSTPVRRRWRPRRAFIQVSLIAVPVAGFLTFAFVRAQASEQDAAQVWHYVANIGVGGAVLGLALFFFGALRTGSFQRERALRRSGNLQWVEESFTTGHLRHRIALLDDPETTSIPTQPIWVSISMDNEGMKLWSGNEDAKEYVSLPWGRIDDPGPAMIVDYPRRSRGFGMDVTTDDLRRYRLEIPLLGRGMFGIRQAYSEDIDELVAVIRSRIDSVRQGPEPLNES